MAPYPTGCDRYPESARIGRVEGTRELVIDRPPYITAYRVAGDRKRRKVGTVQICGNVGLQ